MFTSQSRLWRVGGVVLEWTLGVALLGLIYLHFAPEVKSIPSAAASGNSVAAAANGNGGSAAGAPLATCGTSTLCVTDDVTGDHLSWNCATGAYTFTRCSDGFTISGTGTPSVVNSVAWLTAFLPDRRISADLMLNQGTGRVAISFKTGPGMYQNFTINQRIPFAPCGTCGAPLKKPSGGHKKKPKG